MALINWSDSFSTGIAEQDEQHKNLIYLINRLHTAIEEGKDADILETVLAQLVDYTIFHFGYEERLMRRHDYADTPAHISEHDGFVEAVYDFKQKLESGSAVISVQIINFLKMWLTGHIMKTDKRMGQELRKIGVK